MGSNTSLMKKSMDAVNCYDSVTPEVGGGGYVTMIRKTRSLLLEDAVPQQSETHASMGLVAQSSAMRRVVDQAERVAKFNCTVLITGESGTGKERIARLLHTASARAERPFLAVNCGAISESLIESELFGHARGAFTGAHSARAGLFEAADGGTLLLDEVAELPRSLQVKLLRVLQEREIRRVGENNGRRVDVRIVAATNRDLANGSLLGALRQDLYYRLKVVGLHVPPLRERTADILALAQVLLTAAGLRLNRKLLGVAPCAAQQILRYNWPGNVRELENAMERAVALSRGGWVEAGDLPEEVSSSTSNSVDRTQEPRSLDEIEREHILEALKLNDGNRTHTAAQLRIGSATLYRKLKRYGGIVQSRSTSAFRLAGGSSRAGTTIS
jgi:two-component system, NtrC family, response regulator HydG